MKIAKTFIASVLAGTISLTALGQGKVSFGNDSNHYFVIGANLAGDTGGGIASTAGNTVSGCTGAIPMSPLPSGKTLVAALYAGTTAGNLALQKSVVLNATGWLQAGRMVNNNVILTGVPGGSLAYFRIDVYDNAFGDGAAAKAAGSYYGTSGLFTATPGAGITYPNLFAGGPAGSTWAAGNIVLGAIPEPSSLTLVALGACGFLLRRRVTR
jgi:hypothetical protein